MDNVIQPAQMQTEIDKILKQFGENTTEVVNECVQTVAEKATAELKTAGTFKGRKYRGSWTNEVQKKPGYTDAVVFNKRNYRLTHLLEFGHAKQNGGRTRAFPHIAPVNDKVAEMFEKELMRKI